MGATLLMTAIKLKISQGGHWEWIDANVKENGLVSYELPEWLDPTGSWQIMAIITPDSDGQPVVPMRMPWLRYGDILRVDMQPENEPSERC
jgi:hypothetical protein